jgi:hypothetical protein
MYINGRVYKTNANKNTRWVFPNSNGVWYSPINNGYSIKWGTLGIVSNSNMTVSFTIKITAITAINADYRNIFHVTNTGADANRNPAVWILPGAATNLHVVSSTTSTASLSKNTGSLPMNQEINVDLMWSVRTLYVYFNGQLDTQFLLDNTIVAANANADLYIASPWHSQGGFQIKDFKIVNGVSVRHTDPPSLLRSTAWLGKSQFSQDSPYNGYMDDFRIYNTVLTPTDISALYNYSTPTRCSNLTSVIIPTGATTIGIIIIIIIIILLLRSLLQLLLQSTLSGDNAFKGCVDLTFVTIPSSVTTIGTDNDNTTIDVANPDHIFRLECFPWMHIINVYYYSY